jgi:hypothetical protein
MLAACLLLFIAVSGGTLLTFVYDRQTHFAARLATGTCTGLVLLATAGFVFSWWMGLNSASITVSAAVLLLPWCLLFIGRYRTFIFTETVNATRAVWQALISDERSTIAYFLFYAVMAGLLGVVFSRALVTRADGIYTGLVNNLGDLPLHLQVITSFVQGQNIHAEDPVFAGVRFTYPLLADFLSAMLVRAGATLMLALWLPGVTMALALTGIMHHWTLTLTRNRLAGLIAPLLLMFSGGLGWVLIFQDVRNSDHGLFPMLARLPHDYTIMSGSIYRWGNALTALLVPQRSLLFGLPLAICIFCQLWLALEEQPLAGRRPHSEDRHAGVEAGAVAAQPATDPQVAPHTRLRMAGTGFFAGLSPLVHTHTFIVILLVACCLAIIFRAQWRSWLVFFAVMLLAALPECLWLARSSGFQARTFIGWQFGWDHGDHNILWFWLVNTGAFLPLLAAAFVLRKPGSRIPRKLLLFLSPFLLCFLIPNIIKVAPWTWDNIKILVYWYVGSIPVVALLLAHWLQPPLPQQSSSQQSSAKCWLAIALLASLVFSGALDILRVVSKTTEYLEFDNDGISMARLISQIAAPQAVVLHAPVYNSPVFLTGRRSLLGYPGWIWSRGMDYSQREMDIRNMYSGSTDVGALLKQYNVGYVLLGPQEVRSLAVSTEFWNRYPLMAHIGDYRLYKVEQGR